MSRPEVPALAGMVGAAIVLGLVGCGGAAESPSPPASSAPAGASLPPRPVELRLDGVDPCSLLTVAQRAQLGVNGGLSVPSTHVTSLSGDSCTWSNLPETPDNAYLGRTVLGQGAEYASGGEPLRVVDGFAATTSGSTGTDPAHYCAVLVDVAPGQSLLAQYGNGRKDYPGMNHQLACDKAQQLASDMLGTLRAIKHR